MERDCKGRGFGLIITTDGLALPSEDALVAALEIEFGRDCVRAVPITSSLSKARFHIEVQPKGEPPFGVRQLGSGNLTSDGTASQDARVAARVRSLLSDDATRVIALDDDAVAYVDLVAGITSAQVANGWRDIAEGGF